MRSELRFALLSILQQNEKYFAACSRKRNYLEATENAISLRLLPRIEKLITDDIIAGKDHVLKYGEPYIFNNQKALMTDTGIFCNYQGASTGIAKMFYNLEGNYDLMYEGKKLLQMIADIETMPLADFNRKYNEPIRYNGIDSFINAVDSVLAWDKFRTYKYNSNSFIGCLYNPCAELTTALFRFYSANKIHFDPKITIDVSISGRNLIWHNHLIEIPHIIIGSGRKNKGEKFMVDFIEIRMDDYAGGIWNYRPTPEQGIFLGEKMEYIFSILSLPDFQFGYFGEIWD